MSTDTSTEEVSPLDPDDELLVAYLDGELDSRERDELEDRLLQDESLRQKLQSLQTGWEMLDELPAPTTNERLVESTLELVVSDILKAAPEQPEEKSPQRFRIPLLIGAFALLAAIAGWSAGFFNRSSIEHHQLQNLALAENLDAYLWGSDLTLMRILQNDPAWLNMVSTAKEMGQLNYEPMTKIQTTPVSGRFEVIASMVPESRAILETRWEELAQLDADSREKIKQTAAKIEIQPESELLIKTMSQYAAWRSTLPAEMRDAIEQTEGIERKKAIAEAITYTLDSVSRRSGGMLSEETVIRIDHALETFLADRTDADPKLKAAIDKHAERYSEGAHVYAIMVMLADENQSRSRSRFSRPPGYDAIAPITMSELDSIIAILDVNALDDLNLLTNWSPYSGHDPRLLESTLRTWAEETARRKFDQLRPERGTLIERYSELSNAERDRIDLLPPSEIKRRLSDRGRSFGR
ncbi:zf-HC2 domain-containing protein [Planctomycetes bacterium K23_9]|uniref:Zinc-finger domain-containing protein n=1 Tax=Stieleria marina TaxID=1930275 RepID=A0A517NVQ8_9BACT|nr:hypothetical protein K239x_31950 [Planctomycetes bacterium K23_9]